MRELNYIISHTNVGHLELYLYENKFIYMVYQSTDMLKELFGSLISFHFILFAFFTPLWRICKNIAIVRKIEIFQSSLLYTFAS